MVKDKKRYEKGSIGYYIELAEEVKYPYVEDLKKNLVIAPFIRWSIEKGIFKRNTKIEREYRNKLAREKGYSDDTERRRHDFNKQIEREGYDNFALPMSENKNCAPYFGIEIAEKYVFSLFDDAERMPPNNPGYDWICKKGEKIQSIARCLCKSKDSLVFVFAIKYNNLTDYFILTGWDNRDSLNPLRVWLIHKDEIIRGRKLWERDSLSIINRPEYLAEFKKYEITDKLEKLKDLCKTINK